jgi:radical SAM protein with 4Fe4S-binding SPASM domain
MTSELSDRAVRLIGDVGSDHILTTVHVNGHGETTFLPGWAKITKSLLDQNLRLALTSNLAKQFTNEEFEILARMDTIMVSIDTADPVLLRRLRRSVSLSRIVHNIEETRRAAARLGVPAPNFRISCGLYDQNTLSIAGLAQFAIEHDMKGVGFWNLSSWSFDRFPYENTDVSPKDRAYPLDDLSNDELRPRLAAISNAIEILKRNGIDTYINGDFIDNLARRLESREVVEATARSHHLPTRTTRDCLDPWRYCEINTNGDVQPCCAHSRIGNLHDQDLAEILNGPTVRELRRNLLEGTPDAECANCRLRGAVSPNALQQQLESWIKESDEANHIHKVEKLLNSAFEDLKAGCEGDAWTKAQKALAIDPGIEITGDNAQCVRDRMPEILAKARLPLTLSWLAGMFRYLNDNRTAIVLLKRYVELAPDAPDKENVLQGIRDAEWSISVVQNSQSGMAVKDGQTRVEQMWSWVRRKIRIRTRMRRWRREPR